MSTYFTVCGKFLNLTNGEVVEVESADILCF